MTDLQHIEIEGFKGLEHVELDPTDINLITGRNNTGKTSFLEGVELSYSPGEIKRFEGKVGSIVRSGFAEADIEAKTEARTNELKVRSASADEADRYFREALTEHFRSSVMTGMEFDENDDSHHIFSYRTSSIGEIEELGERFQEAISKTVTRATNEIPDSLRGLCHIIEFNGDDYPYLYFERNDRRLVIELNAILEDVLLEDFDEEILEEHIDSYIVRDTKNRIVEFETGYSSILDGGFFLKEPPELGDVRFVKQDWLSTNTKDTDDENEAIRVDDVGDFLKDKEIVNNLKTFNLETLIFLSEEEGKYPVPYDFMGDGFKSMVNLLWELMDDDVENEIVLIEEPENHMHPGYVSELVHFLIDLARDEDIQFFITTHDHDFIKDFFAEMPPEKREYLEEEFSLVKMDDFGADVLSYEDAEHHLKDLHLDLRGI